MHPATATTPFALLWALEKNEEDPPFRPFGVPTRAQAQQSRSAPIAKLPTVARPETAIPHDTAYTLDSAPEAATAKPTQNECAASAFAASDFLVTNLRPDLLA